MKIEIVFKEKDWLKLTNYFSLDNMNESGAIGFCKLSSTYDLKRFLLNKMLFPDRNDYKNRSKGFVGFKPSFMENCFRIGESNHFHLLDIHTHPFSKDVRFSEIDNREDGLVKGPYMDRYVPNVELLFMVHGSNLNDIDARVWNKESKSLVPVDLVKIL